MRNGSREARERGIFTFFSVTSFQILHLAPFSFLPPSCLPSWDGPARSERTCIGFPPSKIWKEEDARLSLSPLPWKFNSSSPLKSRQLEKQVLPVPSRNAGPICRQPPRSAPMSGRHQLLGGPVWQPALPSSLPCPVLAPMSLTFSARLAFRDKPCGERQGREWGEQQVFEGRSIRSVRSHLATHHMTRGKILPRPGLYFLSRA